MLKTSPDFEWEYLFLIETMICRYSIWAKIDAALEHGKAVLEGRDKGNKYGVECPYCHATNVSSNNDSINRAVSTGLLGLASSKMGKTVERTTAAVHGNLFFSVSST